MAMGSVFESSRSALLKHEVAYVLGQMQEPRSAPILKNVLQASLSRRAAFETLEKKMLRNLPCKSQLIEIKSNIAAALQQTLSD
jgi:hypothetical protein